MQSGAVTAGAQFAPDGSLRPPWSSESSIRASCTSCGSCIQACPENILRRGRSGTPVVDFDAGACTFCADCAEACPEPVFDLSRSPWDLTAEVQANCLLNSGVTCRTCTDVCEVAALRFELACGSVGRIKVETEACTGCGACIPVCPVSAIAVKERTSPQRVRS